MLTLHGIAKPAYRAFELLHTLGDRLLRVIGSHPTVEMFPTRDAADRLVILLTNHARPRHSIRNERVEVRLTHRRPAASAVVRRIDSRHANPRALWKAMGEPSHLSAEQIRLLDAASTCVSEPLELSDDGKATRFELDLPAHGVACVTIDQRAAGR